MDQSCDRFLSVVNQYRPWGIFQRFLWHEMKFIRPGFSFDEFTTLP
jgi:hypothetical protein